MTKPLPRISVTMASKGRAEILGETLDSILRQTYPPLEIVVVVVGQEDIPRREFPQVRFLIGEAGITKQRNLALKSLVHEVDFVACFDDDLELRPDYLQVAAEFILAAPAVVAFSGRMLADGGITRAQARELIDRPVPTSDYSGNFRSSGKYHLLSGCNMMIKRQLLEYERFDEELPLYAFGEDYDISVRLERYGIVGRFQLAHCVHLQTPSGRVNEVRRGYAMVANNWHFLRKGIVHRSRPLALLRFWVICVGDTIRGALVRYLQGDRTLDWLGRIRGCLLASRDILTGRDCTPRRILDL